MAARRTINFNAKRMYDVAGLPVIACTTFAASMAAYSGVRCFMSNPDVRSRKNLHDPVPGEDTAKAGAEWRKQHHARNIGNEAGNVSMFSAFGFKRIAAEDEYFPSSPSRA
ncbi:hypothetical protein FNF27_01184 [Cafeteria roenbergensis]|uniref:Uncharacterized protein n=1 Tax=Cafeteria roenbergensis TaxID=33653 RepID=A0A5A8CUB5_CAFRO|nr:hypothetical protein FNF31_06512 [Cafeteria roenbergensis]KAA0156675.1 hypothetical protein FNF29_00786 [Cafeteria roenbergensis]KAA0177406.1 hypothetical protein FNF27_01184 [Cafeteria roenbergensis]|eukprot:KAA0156675.1 hypothetical protein FNF29_00786 [Cafeteria roenbergensis]